MLDMPDGPHLAIKRRLREYGGSIVAHRSRADVESRAAGLLGSFSAISALTLLWTCVLLGTTAYMVLAKLHDEADKERRQSDAKALRQRQRLVRSRDAIIFGLAKLAESRDPETGDHLDRIAVYSTTLAAALRRIPKYKGEITPGFVSRIEISSALHDIGKVGIEDRILRKPDSLTDEERSLMQTHTMIGGACLRGIELRLGSSNFLQMAREIAFSHHERWDGAGYPEGLKGTQIPLAARIVAIADVYDALSTNGFTRKPFRTTGARRRFARRRERSLTRILWRRGLPLRPGSARSPATTRMMRRYRKSRSRPAANAATQQASRSRHRSWRRSCLPSRSRQNRTRRFRRASAVVAFPLVSC